MPQLDISTYPSQLFWLIISFSILYACMHWLIVPRISKVFHKRRGLLEDRLEEIEHFRKEIEHLEIKIERLSSQSQKDSMELLTNTKRECTKLFAEEEIKLQKKAAESLESFTKKMELRVQEVEGELFKKREEFSHSILQKVLETSPDINYKEGKH